MYFKNVKDGYVISYGRGSSGEEITEAEYEAIKTAISSMPSPVDGYTYKLRADNLEWELVELPPEPEPGEEEIDDAEAFDIIFGGAE